MQYIWVLIILIFFLLKHCTYRYTAFAMQVTLVLVLNRICKSKNSAQEGSFLLYYLSHCILHNRVIELYTCVHEYVI